MFAIKTEMHYQAVRRMMWSTVFECIRTCARCHHPTDNKVSKCWGQQWRQGKRRLIKSGTPFPFFPRRSVECEARQKLLISGEEKCSLCQHDIRNGNQTSKVRPKHEEKGPNPQTLSPPNICADLCSLLSVLIIPQSRFLDLLNPIVVWVQNQDGKKKKPKKTNYLLAWCLSAKLLIFSTAYFKEASRHSTLWVFTLKLKECFTNWQEVVHFN